MYLARNANLFVYILFISIFCDCFAQSALVENYIVNNAMEKKIMFSSLSSKLRTNNGDNIIAYLYAEDEKKDPPDEFYSCRSGEIKNYETIDGHYYIYLYNTVSKQFMPYRTKIFINSQPQFFHMEGADLMTISSTYSERSDILLISQFGACTSDVFEAYGFSKDNQYLEPYQFYSKTEPFNFYGVVSKVGGAPEVFGYGTLGLKKGMYNVTLSVSKIIGRVQVELTKPDA
ncbi:MAG: hypothetical protein ACRC0B_08730 [Legionella sp.]